MCRFAFLHIRADDGARTRDLNLGKVALYQLSYIRAATQQSLTKPAGQAIPWREPPRRRR